MVREIILQSASVDKDQISRKKQPVVGSPHTDESPRGTFLAGVPFALFRLHTLKSLPRDIFPSQTSPNEVPVEVYVLENIEIQLQS